MKGEGLRKRLILYLMASFFMVLGLLAPLLLATEPAVADGYAWTDTGGGLSSAWIMSLSWGGAYLYAGTNNTGVWRYDPAAGLWSDTGGGVRASCLAWDGTGLYAGTGGKGVWRYDPAAGEWTDTGGGLSTAWIMSLVWNGTYLYAGTNYGSGVWRYDPAMKNWTEIGGGTIKGGYLAWDGNGLYAGLGGTGVWRYDPATGLWSDTGGWVVKDNILSMAWDGSGLYVSGAYSLNKVMVIYGVWRYDPKALTWAYTGMSDTASMVRSMVWDGCNLFAGTSGRGVLRFDTQTWTWSDTDGIKSGTINSLAYDGWGIYAGTQSSGVWRYAYQGAPSISSLSPTSGPVGTEVTINGTSFRGSQGSSCVSFGSVKATDYTSWSDTQIRCKVPSVAPGDVPVKVVTGGGTSSGFPFKVTVPSELAVASVSPNQANQFAFSTDLTITGSGFQPGAAVWLEKGTTSVVEAFNVTIASDTQITCTVALFGTELGPYDVVVKNPDNHKARFSGGFTVTPACGSGSGAALLLLGVTLGLLSLTGSGILGRKSRKRARL